MIELSVEETQLVRRALNLWIDTVLNDEENDIPDRSEQFLLACGIDAKLTSTDPFPVGAAVTVTDYDGSTLGPFQVIRSYWPQPVVELLTPDGMVRQNHDRMVKA